MSSWPSAAASPFSSTAIAERKRARRRELAVERIRENDTAPTSAGRNVDSSPSPISERNLALLQEVHRRLRGPEFAAWYEACTGDSPAAWLHRIAISPEEFLEYHGAACGYTQLEWTEEQIRQVGDRNPWSNPERRAYWGAMLANCTNPGERRRLIIRMATPKWANAAKMAELYLERDRMQIETGEPHHVDHIVPLVHPLVCGLHWEGNLRVITALENQRKSNRFDPDELPSAATSLD